MSITRRALLHSGLKFSAAAAALNSLPRPLLARLGRTLEPLPPIHDPGLKELAARALDAARSAGAGYADVRLTHERIRVFGGQVQDSESMLVGVRTLVNGYWGFASSSVWTPDEMSRLARESVHQAKTNALGKARAVDLAPTQVIADGNWAMPVGSDPFETSPFEINDFLASLEVYLHRTPGTRITANGCTAVVQEKAFASTSGSYCTQRCYRTEGVFGIDYTLEHGQRGLDRVVGRQARVAQRRRLNRVEIAQRHQEAGGRNEHELGHAAVAPEAATAGAARPPPQLAEGVVALDALPAGAAAPWSVDRDRVAFGHLVDPRAGSLHPAGVLVAERERH